MEAITLGAERDTSQMEQGHHEPSRLVKPFHFHGMKCYSTRVGGRTVHSNAAIVKWVFLSHVTRAHHRDYKCSNQTERQPCLRLCLLSPEFPVDVMGLCPRNGNIPQPLDLHLSSHQMSFPERGRESQMEEGKRGRDRRMTE